MHEKDRNLILLIQDFFGGIGHISKPNNRSTVEFRVNTLTDLVNIILPHFYKYPLVTKKHYDYYFFKQIILLMSNKEHTTLDGIENVVSFRAKINTGGLAYARPP
jgi:hypothetical protein